MKRIAIIVAALISCVVMSAQDVKVKSKVELKGGKGEIVGYAEKQDDGGYVVETESGDVFYYSVSEIKKITQLEAKEEKVKEEKVKIVEEKPTYDFSGDRSKTKGYMGIVEAGIGLNCYNSDEIEGVSVVNNYSEVVFEPSVVLINGYRFSPHFFAGLGIGFNNTLENFSLPLFLHLRTEFSKKKNSPYLALSGGVTLPYEYEMGGFGELNFGLRSHLSKHGSMWYGLSVGFVSEYSSYTYTNWDDYGNSYDTINSYDDTSVLLSFKIAYSF